VDDVVTVKVTDTTGYLTEVVTGLVLGEVGFLTDLAEETTTGCELEEEVDFVLV
jgi:hypothetical protein